MEKNKRKQMAFDISPEMHREVKILAAMRNISVSCWVTRAINDRIIKEKKYDKNES